MNEIAPGIWQWNQVHPDIGAPVSSYYLDAAATVLDPMEPDEGFEWFEGKPVDRVVLSSYMHYRHADQFHARFDVPVVAPAGGADHLAGRPGVETFAFGEEFAPGLTAHPVEPSWPGEAAIHIALGDGLLSIGDGAMHYGEEIEFIPDEHLGDEPDQVKVQLRAGYGQLLDLDFDTLLFTHGAPIVGGGKAALRAFVDGG